jgi:hypothetical protein
MLPDLGEKPQNTVYVLGQTFGIDGTFLLVVLGPHVDIVRLKQNLETLGM